MKRERGEQWNRVHRLYEYVLFHKTFTYFSCTYVFYMATIKGISVALLWAVVETCESCCCNLYSYFTLLCIGEIEQQKLLGGQKIGFLWSLLPVGKVERGTQAPLCLLKTIFSRSQEA